MPQNRTANRCTQQSDEWLVGTPATRGGGPVRGRTGPRPSPVGAAAGRGRDKSHNLARPANSKEVTAEVLTRRCGSQCNRKVRGTGAPDKRPAETCI